MQPIFIIASERSGTNLLRTLLGKHHTIEAPVAPHLLNAFYPYLRYYGNLEDGKKCSKLINDAISLVNHPYHNWKLNINKKKIFEKYNPSSLVTVLNALYQEKAESVGKTAYVSKGIHNFDYVPLIKQELPNSKFIYLYRDPRDKVASLLRKPLHMHTAFEIINIWNKEQHKCLTMYTLYQDDIIKIKYENLIKNTENEITKVLNFLNLKIDSNCFSTDKNNTEAKRNEFWKNLDKPIIQNNDKKYKDQLSSNDILIIESLAKENMRDLGYTDFDTSADWNESNSISFRLSEIIKKFLSKRKNKNFFNKEMAELKDKTDLMKDIRKNIKIKHENDTYN